MLQAISHQFSLMFVPFIKNLDESHWGKLSGRDGDLMKVDFLGKLSMFVSTLDSAQEVFN
jgi:hypothetical protein